MFMLLLLTALTLGPSVALHFIKPQIHIRSIPVFMGMMGVWLALGTLLCLYTGYDFVQRGEYPFELDLLNIAIISSYGFGLFTHYYRKLT